MAMPDELKQLARKATAKTSIVQDNDQATWNAIDDALLRCGPLPYVFHEGSVSWVVQEYASMPGLERFDPDCAATERSCVEVSR